MTFDLIQVWEQALAHEDSAPSARRRHTGVLRDFLAWYEVYTREPFDPPHLTPADPTSYRAHR